MKFYSFVRKVSLLGFIAIIGVSIAGSSSSAIAAGVTPVTSAEPQVEFQTPEERREELFTEFKEKFDNEVSEKVDSLISEREKKKLTNDKLEEFEKSITEHIFSEGVVAFTSSIFFESKYVEEMEESYAVQAEKIDSIVEEWKAELEEEVKREAEREKERLRKEEEARKAAEQAAAEAAAAAQQQSYNESYYEAPAPSSSGGGGGGSSAPVADYTVRIAGAGGQGLIDACVGAVWWSGWSGLLAEHWHCGGSWFPQYAGAIINVPGSGLYRSAGVVGVVNQATSNVSSIPGGYDIVYQTCLNNNPATTGFIGLTRIG